MKKILLTFILLSLPVFASEKVSLSPETDYIYFSDSKINDVKISDKNIIKGHTIGSLTGTNSQILFSALSKGVATVDIDTDKGVISYEIEVSPNAENNKEAFVEIDVPQMKTEK